MTSYSHIIQGLPVMYLIVVVAMVVVIMAMCMEDSDDGETIAMVMGKEGVATNDMDYFAMVHKFALNKLKDHDGVFNIRRYFKDVLWPEKNQAR